MEVAYQGRRVIGVSLKKRHDAQRQLDLVHSDLCGPMSKPSSGGALYFLVIVDEATRITYVAFLKKKSDTLEEFKSFFYHDVYTGILLCSRTRN